VPDGREVQLLPVRAERRLAHLSRYADSCNYYADGNDSISFHQDSEQFLGPNPTIASLTLGASRDFLLRPRKDKGVKVQTDKYVLESGDMVCVALALRACARS
jgi:alkylated DNA repair dioxygenase AlkB